MFYYYEKCLSRLKMYYIRIKLFGGSRMNFYLFMNFFKWMMIYDIGMVFRFHWIHLKMMELFYFKMLTLCDNDIFCNS